MQLHQAQKIIAKDKHRFRIVNCGRRFGKTTLAVEEIKGKALSKPSRIAYIAPTYQQARDIAWQMLVSELQPIITNKNESRLELEVLTQDGGKSFIALRGWESIETLRGQQYDLIIIDEIASMRNFWSNWQEVVRPTLTDTRGEGIFISTPKGFNHFYELYNMENVDSDYKSFHFTSYDNPLIPADEIDKAKKEITEDRFAQEYMADFRKTEGLVYKEFKRDEHLYKEKGFEGEEFRSVKRFGGVDFGFKNPAAIILIEKDYDSNYWVDFEWYQRGKTDAQIAEYASGLRLNEYYPDPESAGGIQELRNKGCHIKDVAKNSDSVKNGINIVRELFLQKRLFINKECENLIWELETYSYPEKKFERNENENPIKENDHALDALRYALMMESNQKEKSVHIHRPAVRQNVGWSNRFK